MSELEVPFHDDLEVDGQNVRVKIETNNLEDKKVADSLHTFLLSIQ